MSATRPSGPPAAGRWLLRSLAADDRTEALIGDLEELWRDRRNSVGGVRAGAWYLWQAVTVAWSYRRGGRVGPTSGERVRDAVALLGTGLRVTRRAPGYALAVTLTLALGVGATLAVFSLVSGVLLEPLPYPGSERVTFVHETHETVDTPPGWATVPNYLDWREQAASFEALALFRGGSVSITTDVTPEYAYGALITSEFFDVFGVEPVLGRRFTPADADGPAAVVILGHGVWTRGFAAEPGVIGRAVRIDGQPHTVVGVMPPGFEAHGDWVGVPVQLWRPFQMTSDVMQQGRSFHVAGRLAEGVALEEARAEMEALAAQLSDARPEENDGWSVRLVPYREMIVGDVAPALWLMLGATSLLLLIAAANVASLTANRALDRTRETATRRALGATRRSVVALVLAESAVLAVAGGLVGLGLAEGLVRVVRALEPGSLPRLTTVGIDGRVGLFAGAVVAAAALGGGAVAALAASRTTPACALRSAGVAASRGGARSALVAGQLALSFLLLVTAGLLVRSFQGLRSTDLGFDPSGVTAATVALSWNRVGTLADRTRFSANVLAALRTMPGVASAGMINSLPLSGSDASQPVEVEGVTRPGEEPAVATRGISPGYLETLRIPLASGRDLTQQDVDDPRVVLVNQAAVERYWPGTAAVGRRLRARGTADWLTVVGVVGNVRHFGPERTAAPEIYLPYSSEQLTSKTFLVRWQRGASPEPARVRDAIHAVDGDQPVREVRSMEAWSDLATAAPRFQALTMALAAGLATALATVGLFGLVAGLVRGRTPELALRMALGAPRARVLGLVTRRALLLVTAGVVGGVGLALPAGAVLRRFLFGVSPYDPVIFAGACVLFVVVAAVASLLPARRATSLDPARVLRAD